MDYRNVKSDDRLLREMIDLTKGSRQVPVIVEEGKVRIGFGGS